VITIQFNNAVYIRTQPQKASILLFLNLTLCCKHPLEILNLKTEQDTRVGLRLYIYVV